MFKYRMGITVLLAFVLAVTPVFAQAETAIDLSGRRAAAFDKAMLADFEDYVRAAMEEYSITGAAVAIVQDGGQSTYLGTFGMTGQDSGQPVDSETRFMIGSTTKSMTVLLMAQLVDKGLVNWNTPVTDVLPEFALIDPEATSQIRVRDLFNMSSGVPRYDLPRHLFSLTAQDTFYWLNRIPLVSKPGEDWNYNNFTVTAGGWLAAVLTGTPYDADLETAYADLMQSRVFDPIGMERATFDCDAAFADPNHAVPYGFNIVEGELTFDEVPDFMVERDVAPIAPASGVWASIEDMAKYVAFYMNDGVAEGGERLVSSENLKVAHTSEIKIADGVGYGLGWYVIDLYGQPLLWHGGNTPGFTTDMSFLPEGDLGIIVLSNRDIVTSFTDSLVAYILEKAFDLEHTPAEQYLQQDTALKNMVQELIAGFQPVDVTTVDAAYTGEYEFGLTARVEGDQFLIGTATGDVPLFSTGEAGQFVMASMLGANRVTFAEAEGVMTMTLETLLNLNGPPEVMTLNKVG
jgi:CubicO group peptidase (beta-lactamase class C family)